MRHFARGLATLALVVATASSAQAALIQISNLTDLLAVGGTYATGTTNMEATFSGLANGTSVSAFSDATLTVGLSDLMTKGQVGVTFETWGSPPDTENSAPAILNTFGNPNVTTRTLTFSHGLAVFGVEAESGDFGVHHFTMAFFEGATLLGSIARDIEGNAGARILAGESSFAFDRVVITQTTGGGDPSFAVAEPRYHLAAVAEPATLTLVGAGLATLLASRRRRSERSPADAAERPARRRPDSAVMR